MVSPRQMWPAFLPFKSGEIQQQIKEEAENLVKNSVTVNITTKQIRDLLMQDVVAAYRSMPGIIPFGPS